MGFKLACISGRASLIDDNNYYDLEAISQGEFDEDTSNALLNIEGLNKLSANLEKFEPSGLKKKTLIHLFHPRKIVMQLV